MDSIKGTEQNCSLEIPSVKFLNSICTEVKEKTDSLVQNGHSNLIYNMKWHEKFKMSLPSSTSLTAILCVSLKLAALAFCENLLTMRPTKATNECEPTFSQVHYNKETVIVSSETITSDGNLSIAI